MYISVEVCNIKSKHLWHFKVPEEEAPVDAVPIAVIEPTAKDQFQ
jgi:hypothetical protein